MTTEVGESRTWTWEEMMALPQEEPTVDIHCVNRWSKFDTRWRGVPLDAFLDEVETAADFVVAESFDGYTANRLWRTSPTARPGWRTPSTAVDPTTAWRLCPSCRLPATMAQLHVYGPEPGLTARCPGCAAIAVRVVAQPQYLWLQLGGTAGTFRFAFPSPHHDPQRRDIQEGEHAVRRRRTAPNPTLPGQASFRCIPLVSRMR
ncbi:DUF6510 family protein [Streptomyces sp. NPDC046979]|uniref:DUF6510 family protein n=1 Tax=Streptomyces sp. NPDC046979 TaxID=3154604 RepID=UPI0033E717BD